MPEGAATSASKKGRHSSKSSVETVRASGSPTAGDASSVSVFRAP